MRRVSRVAVGLITCTGGQQRPFGAGAAFQRGFQLPQRRVVRPANGVERQAWEIWDDAEPEAFIDFIARNPEGGDLIPETGGVRKIRWARPLAL